MLGGRLDEATLPSDERCAQAVDAITTMAAKVYDAKEYTLDGKCRMESLEVDVDVAQYQSSVAR